MSDLISRQAAINVLNEYFARIGKLKRRGLTEGEKAISLDTVGAIKTLPSAQPTIIRCNDCKYWKEKPYKYCERMYHMGFAELLDYTVEENDFCSWAVKRGDTE